jgi:hypothetical protein
MAIKTRRLESLALLPSPELWNDPCLVRYKGLSCILGRPLNKVRQETLSHNTQLIQDKEFYYVMERTKKDGQPRKRVSTKQYIYTPFRISTIEVNLITFIQILNIQS